MQQVINLFYKYFIDSMGNMVDIEYGDAVNVCSKKPYRDMGLFALVRI